MKFYILVLSAISILSTGALSAHDRRKPVDLTMPAEQEAGTGVRKKVPFGTDQINPDVRKSRESYKEASTSWGEALNEYLAGLDDATDADVAAFTRANFEAYLELMIKREEYVTSFRDWSTRHEPYIPGMKDVPEDPELQGGGSGELTPRENLEVRAYRRAAASLLQAEAEVDAANTEPEDE